MNIAVHEKESSQERTIRTALTGALEPGETLYEYTQASLTTSFLSSNKFWVGLTDRRFIFIKPKKTARVSSILFSFIEAAGNEAKAGIGRNALNIQMAHTKDRLSFLAFQNWQPYLARMVEQYPQVAAAHGSAQGAPTVQQALRQVEDLEGMDLVNQSTALLTALEAVTPGLRNEPAAQAIRERTGNMRLSMRVAAGIFTTVIVLTLVLALLGQMKVGLGIVLAILATIELVRGSISARGAALTLSLLTVVLNMIINAAAGSLIDAIIWGAFGVAMALLLAGHPGKARIFSALGIFILGFFTPMALALVVTLLGG